MSEILNTLKTFYPDEYAMIEYLAAGDTKKFYEMAEYDPAYVEHLVGYGLIVRRGDDFEFAFASAEEAIKRRLVSRENPGLPSKWEEISRRRNRIEEEIRRALYQWAMRLAPSDWYESWQVCITAKRRGELGTLTRQEAFSKNHSRLYLVELLKFVEHSGEYSDTQSSVGNILEAIQVVNKYRIDAHANDIDEVNFDALTRSLNVLETVFVPPP